MLAQVSSRSYHNFINTCRSPVTRKHYVRSLQYFMSFMKIDDCDKLVDLDPKLIQVNICDYIVFMRSRNLAPQSIAAYVSAIRKFFDMNDIITLNWKKIHSFEPEPEYRSEDRPYTHQEIATLLSKASPRDRAIFLIMASSGVRAGAITYPFLLRDLQPIDKYKIYKLTVYRKSPARYYTFCSPEARKEIDCYLNWRRRLGEQLNDDSPVFRKSFDPFEVQRPAAVTFAGLSWIINNLLKQSGLRTFEPLKEGRTLPKRTEIMQCHAFRKFFETQSFKAGMNHMYIRRLMGQKSNLEDSYLKLSESDLLEGDDRHVGYIGAFDFLTISEENRLKRKVVELTIKADKVDELSADFAALKQKLGF
jgi:site-specific recombinase XerD